MNIDNSDNDNKSVGHPRNIESSFRKPEMNEYNGDDNNGESDELRHVKEETNAMLDDYSMSGGPFRDDMATSTNIKSSSSSSSNSGTAQRKPEVSIPSISTKRKHPLSVSSGTVTEKKVETATHLSNDCMLSPLSLMPPPPTLPWDAAKNFNVSSLTGVTGVANDSVAMPSSVSLPLEFFRQAETIHNWKNCVSTIVELQLSEDSKVPDNDVNLEYLKKSWELLLKVPHLPRILGINHMETINTMTFERYDAQSHTLLHKALHKLHQTNYALIDVYGVLKTMAGLSQSEASMRSSSASGTCSGVSPFDKEDHEYFAQIRLRTDEGNRPCQINQLESIGRRYLTSLEDLGVHKDCVIAFNARYQALLGNAMRRKEYLNPTVDLTLSGRHDILKQMTTALIDNLSSSLNDKQIASAVARCIPAPQSNEVGVVQPYLASFLRAFGHCLDDKQFQRQSNPSATCPAGDTPIKHVLENRPRRYVKGKEHVRVADGSIVVDGRFICLLRDDSLEISVEMKTEIRASKADPVGQIHSACDQVYSHLARHLGVLFNFCGAGVDGKATGIVIMPSCVKIIQLCLENMGTKEVRLVAFESEPLPLMTVENFDLWAERETDAQEKLNQLKKVLYPSNTVRENVSPIPSTNNNNRIPSGIVALATLLVSKRSDLFGAGNIENHSLGTLLGHGSFSCIYSNKHNDDSIVKVSRYGAATELKREAGILKALKKTMGENINNDIGIVQLLNDENLVVRFGCVERMLPANILSPRGVLMERVLPADPNERHKYLLECGGVLKSAIEYLHNHGYTHNDVTPDNILIKIGKPGQPFLIDLGLGTKMGDNVLMKFQGTPRYAHADIFQKSRSTVPWCGQPKYDFAGLAFSMATLSSVPTRRPWSHFQPADISPNHCSDKERMRWNEFVEWVACRSDTAQKLLQEAKFDQRWLKWCNDKIVNDNEKLKGSQM